MTAPKVVKRTADVFGKVKRSPKKLTTNRPKRSAKAAATLSGRTELGYKPHENGEVLVPVSFDTDHVVSPNKLIAGIEASRDQIKKTLRNLTSVFVEDFEVSEIELAVSFSADGKFLGFGVGGSMSVKVKIRPMQEKT